MVVRCALSVSDLKIQFTQNITYLYFENLGPDAIKVIHSLYLYSCY